MNTDKLINFPVEIIEGFQNTDKASDIAVVNACHCAVSIDKTVTVKCLRESIKAIPVDDKGNFVRLTVSTGCLSACLTASKADKASHEKSLKAMLDKRSEENLAQNKRDADKRTSDKDKELVQTRIESIETDIKKALLSGDGVTAVELSNELKTLKTESLKTELEKVDKAIKTANEKRAKLIKQLEVFGVEFTEE